MRRILARVHERGRITEEEYAERRRRPWPSIERGHLHREACLEWVKKMTARPSPRRRPSSTPATTSWAPTASPAPRPQAPPAPSRARAAAAAQRSSTPQPAAAGVGGATGSLRVGPRAAASVGGCLRTRPRLRRHVFTTHDRPSRFPPGARDQAPPPGPHTDTRLILEHTRTRTLDTNLDAPPSLAGVVIIVVP